MLPPRLAAVLVVLPLFHLGSVARPVAVVPQMVSVAPRGVLPGRGSLWQRCA
jgi:hypothetical protein